MVARAAWVTTATLEAIARTVVLDGITLRHHYRPNDHRRPLWHLRLHCRQSCARTPAPHQIYWHPFATGRQMDYAKTVAQVLPGQTVHLAQTVATVDLVLWLLHPLPVDHPSQFPHLAQLVPMQRSSQSLLGTHQVSLGGPLPSGQPFYCSCFAKYVDGASAPALRNGRLGAMRSSKLTKSQKGQDRHQQSLASSLKTTAGGTGRMRAFLPLPRQWSMEYSTLNLASPGQIFLKCHSPQPPRNRHRGSGFPLRHN